VEILVSPFIRGTILGAALVALTAQSPAPAAGDSGDFCTRLGRAVGVDEAKLADEKPGWSVNALNFGQRFIVGGSATTSVNAEAAEPATVEDYKRADAMCVAEGKGAVCRLSGPVGFRFGWKGNVLLTLVLAGESAVVRVEGSKTHCQPGAGQPGG
jgi:hypothetical protein